MSPLERRSSSRIHTGKGTSRVIHQKGKILSWSSCQTALNCLLRSRVLWLHPVMRSKAGCAQTSIVGPYPTDLAARAICAATYAENIGRYHGIKPE